MTETIKINHITKVEGHGRLHVQLDEDKVDFVQLEVFEGARYFEGFMRGRYYWEAPEITARICGICTQGHTIASLVAIEKAMKVKVSSQTQTLRELLLLGSIIQSHVLHLYFLA